jgi:hypothetical protein
MKAADSNPTGESAGGVVPAEEKVKKPRRAREQAAGDSTVPDYSFTNGASASL